MKSCNKCLEEKPFSDFSKDSNKKDGFCTICKKCKSVYRKSYYSKNSERLKAYSRKWASENKDQVAESSKRWIKNNRERHLAIRRNAHKIRYANDECYRLGHIIRSMMQRVLNHSNTEKDFVTYEKIGYTADDLRSHIESLFKPGMSWSNAGEWEVDHVIPVMVMLRSGENRPEVINALENLQPMWAYQNRSKGARYSGDYRKNSTSP